MLKRKKVLLHTTHYYQDGEMERVVDVERYVHFLSEPIFWLRLHFQGSYASVLWNGTVRVHSWIEG